MRELLNKTLTENGALTNLLTGSAVLDFHYHCGAGRSKGEDEIKNLFRLAFAEDATLAVVAAFNIRDARGGAGERRVFRICMEELRKLNEECFEKVAPLIPEYGRWDDLLIHVDNPRVVRIVKDQLRADVASDHPSLMAKWMPSENTSSKETSALAQRWIAALETDARTYRRILSKLRQKIRIVERSMSENRWGEIVYEHVPSRAAMLYRHAFKRHDAERYGEYLKQVASGKKKINASVLYPHELIALVRNGSDDETVEQLWRAMPDYTRGKNGLVVADTSDSMNTYLRHSSTTAMDASVGLALYFATRNRGAFGGMFITFSERPAVVRVDPTKSLRSLYQTAKNAAWDMNTNLQAVFRMILDIAKNGNVAQEEMPQAIYVVSDMEFDRANDRNSTNFDAIREQYEKAGYKMPQLVFWNVMSRNVQTPVTKHQSGAILVSGLSPSLFETVLENPQITPYEMMLRSLTRKQYKPLWEALSMR